LAAERFLAASVTATMGCYHYVTSVSSKTECRVYLLQASRWPMDIVIKAITIKQKPV